MYAGHAHLIEVSIFVLGHELAFAAFLCCLFKLKVLQESDYTATVFRIFKRQVIKEAWQIFVIIIIYTIYIICIYIFLKLIINS